MPGVGTTQAERRALVKLIATSSDMRVVVMGAVVSKKNRNRMRTSWIGGVREHVRNVQYCAVYFNRT